MTAYQVAPPNISCVFEDGIGCGPLNVPLDTIAELKPIITDNKNGTFNYEVVPDIPILQVPMDSWLSCQLWVEEISIPLTKVKLPFIAQPCPEPDIKANLTYNITSGYESCYGGYILNTKINYFCTDNPDLEPHKTFECGSEGRWIATDTTPWPTCYNPADCITTEPEPTTVKLECTTPGTEPTETPGTTPTTEVTGSGFSLTFHRKLLTATFLIASYYAMM